MLWGCCARLWPNWCVLAALGSFCIYMVCSGAIVIRCSLGCVACLVISMALCLSIWLGSGLLCQNVPSLTRLSESVSPASGCLRVLLLDCRSAMFLYVLFLFTLVFIYNLC